MLVHMLSLPSFDPRFEVGEDALLSLPATVSLASLFTPAGLTIANCTETTVTANQPLAAAPRVTYALDNGTSVTLPVVPPPPSGPGLSITLGPMEIRTFMCDLEGGITPLEST